MRLQSAELQSEKFDKSTSMVSPATESKIADIWNNYVASNKLVLDTKGRVIDDINERRFAAIPEIRSMIAGFIDGRSNVYEFKTSLDGYNKRNNLWGFTATKGQMFFNQLVKSSEQNLDSVVSLLKDSIQEPKDLEDALDKIERLESYVNKIFVSAKDKRRVPNPGSVGYFLSYFWQISNPMKWPIMYTSLTTAFTNLGLWGEYATQTDAYRNFYDLNEEIIGFLARHSKQDVNNWDAEHAFWNFTDKTSILSPQSKSSVPESSREAPAVEISANFDIADYLIPKVTRLVELGNEIERSKASQYERLVAEIFKQLDFEVEMLGQGSGRNPDSILRFREDNCAFIVDAKAYKDGYNLGIDDRAIREYINHYCPRLQKEGFKKIGFIIVSNSFKSTFDDFINDITWNTDIKRFVLLTSEALLYLLAYKTKDRLSLATIIESIVSIGNLVSAQSVIEKFEDI